MKNIKKSVPVLLSLLIILTTFPLTALATDVTVSDFTQLQSAIDNASGQTNIIVGNNIAFTGMITIPEGKDIAIISSGNNNYTLSLAAAGYRHFTVSANSVLTLGNITLDGVYNGSYTSRRGGGIIN